MPAWPGGPCPNCGHDMPENMVHCRECRTLLNEDLESDSVEIPVFQPLQELDHQVEVFPLGIYVRCPECRNELRIAEKYIGSRVACKFCQHAFAMNLQDGSLRHLGYFCECPHCQEKLRLASKFVGVKVACKFCHGRIRLMKK